MRRIHKYLAAIVLLSVTVVPSAITAVQAQSPAAKTDVTGKWLFDVTTDAGNGTPTVTLKQQGDSLTGHYSSPTLGEADLKGTAKEQKVSFTFRVEVQGTALVVTYSGTVDTAGTMKGTVDFGGMGGGTFTAKRQ